MNSFLALMERRSEASPTSISLQCFTELWPPRAVVTVASGGKGGFCDFKTENRQPSAVVGPQSEGKYRHQTQQGTISDVRAQM